MTSFIFIEKYFVYFLYKSRNSEEQKFCSSQSDPYLQSFDARTFKFESKFITGWQQSLFTSVLYLLLTILSYDY